MIEELPGGITLVGTAHVAASSVAEVESVLRERRPKQVLVELDARRLEALRDPEAWRKTDVVRILKEGKQHLFLLQLYLASMQAQMGRDTGVAPGAELLRAVQVADEVGAQVVLIDRDIAITLKRGFGALGFWTRLKLFWHLWMELMTPAAGEEKKLDVEALLKSDAITKMTEEFARVAPPIKTALIDERDDFMASHIAERAAAGPAPVVAVVGAGHLAGIRSRLERNATPIDRAPLMALPRKRFPVGLAVGLLIPVLIGVYFGYLLVHGQGEKIVGLLYIWIALHFLLAGLGAILARGHPLAVLTGAVAAPFTSILPLGIKSGWLAGLVQATVKKPKVEDFEGIKRLTTFREFWANPLVRVLTVTSLTILGSEAASIIAGAQLLRQVLG